MSAADWRVKSDWEIHGKCIHGRSLEHPCLECEAYVRTFYPEMAEEEHGTIQ